MWIKRNGPKQFSGTAITFYSNFSCNAIKSPLFKFYFLLFAKFPSALSKAAKFLTDFSCKWFNLFLLLNFSLPFLHKGRCGGGGIEPSQYMAVENINFPFMDDYDIFPSCYRKSILHPRLQFCLSCRRFNRLLDIELCWYRTPSFHRQLDVCVIKKSPLSRQVIVCTTKPASDIKSDFTFRCFGGDNVRQSLRWTRHENKWASWVWLHSFLGAFDKLQKSDY